MALVSATSEVAENDDTRARSLSLSSSMMIDELQLSVPSVTKPVMLCLVCC
jgi:hypothetical protein